MRKSFKLRSKNRNSAILSHAFLRFPYANNSSQIITFLTQVSNDTLDLFMKSKLENNIYVKKVFCSDMRAQHD